MILTDSNLSKSYSWKNDADFSDDMPGRVRFDRHNGNHVLCMINNFINCTGKKNIQDAQRIENLIAKELPFDKISFTSAFNWLKKRYIYN